MSIKEKQIEQRQRVANVIKANKGQPLINGESSRTETRSFTNYEVLSQRLSAIEDKITKLIDILSDKDDNVPINELDGGLDATDK